MFIYFFIFLGSVIFLAPLWFILLLFLDSLLCNDNCLDCSEKILNTIIVHYNKMNLMLKPKLQIASYNCIYYFSLAQIKYNVYLQPYVNKLLDQFLSYFTEENKINSLFTYSFYKNGELCKTYTRQEGTISEIIEPEKYDLFIASKCNLNNDSYYDICTNKMSQEYNYIESSIKFLNIVLSYNGIEYEIKLKLNDYVSYNFYIVDNIIDSAFFKYYLKYQINAKDMDIDYNNFKYTIQLLDHNVNSVELDETQAIVIKKDGYEIIKLTNNQENKSETLSEDEFDKLDCEDFN
jgi:hypothetical protein